MNGADLSPDKRKVLGLLRRQASDGNPGGWIRDYDKDVIPDIRATLRELAIARLIFQPRHINGVKTKFSAASPFGWHLTPAGALAAAQAARASILATQQKHRDLLAENTIALIDAMSRLDDPAKTNSARLGANQKQAMRVLFNNPGITLDRLGAAMRVNPSQASDVIAALRKRTLIRVFVPEGSAPPAPGFGSRRSTRWELTDLGRVAWWELECATAQKLVDRWQEFIDARDAEIVELTEAAETVETPSAEGDAFAATGAPA